MGAGIFPVYPYGMVVENDYEKIRVGIGCDGGVYSSCGVRCASGGWTVDECGVR
jgi:hypothetical protein